MMAPLSATRIETTRASVDMMSLIQSFGNYRAARILVIRVSLGYYGTCHKELEDDAVVIYSYRGEDWNLPKEERGRLEAIPGMFTIQKSTLEEPEIHVKRGRVSKRRKGLIEKRIPRTPDIVGHVRDGGITIDEPCGVDAFDPSPYYGDVPRCAYILLSHVFKHYMMTGELPENEEFIQ